MSSEKPEIKEAKIISKISYTLEDLNELIKKGGIPSKLGKEEIERLARSRKEFGQWKTFLKEHPNHTAVEVEKYFKNNLPFSSREELAKQLEFHNFIFKNKEQILRLLKDKKEEETFALPSHALMFTLIAMFAGKPEKIPRKLLAKNHKELTPEEKKEADEFISSIIHQETKTIYESEGAIETTKHTAVICDNPRVEAAAEIDQSLFKDDLIFREGSLAHYIKRTFGAEGLRHLYGFLIGLEENFRQGHFIWSTNEHLERLGYRRKKNGSFDPEAKKTASGIAKIFQGLFITATKKEGKKQIIQGERLFSIDGFRQEIIDKQIIDEKIKFRATDFWYKNAFEPKGNISGQYTKLLKKIAQENHREHPLTIYFAGLLAILFRMNAEQKMRIPSLMEWCNFDPQDRYALRKLKSLEAELNYMKKHGYLGNWKNDGEKAFPSDCKNPFECCLTLTPPNWLKEEIELIHEKKDSIDFKEQKEIMTLEEFKQLLQQSNLSNNQFGNHLGVSGAYISMLKSGKKPITEEISDKALKYKEQPLTKPTPLSHTKA